MASGFTNSQEQLTPNYYRITIDTSTYSTTEANNDSGGVEAWDYNYFATINTTTNKSKRRARGNIRWNAILMELQKFSNMHILDVTVSKTGPTAETAADDTAVSVAFTIGYDQEEYVLGGWQNVIGAGTFSDTSTYLTTAAYDTLSAANKATAIQNCIKEAITKGITIGGASGYTRRYRALNVDPGSGLVEQKETNITVTQPDTPVNVWADLTVSIIDTMTQQNS